MDDEEIEIRAMALSAKLSVAALKDIIYRAYQLLKAERDDEAFKLLETAVKARD